MTKKIWPLLVLFTLLLIALSCDDEPDEPSKFSFWIEVYAFDSNTGTFGATEADVEVDSESGIFSYEGVPAETSEIRANEGDDSYEVAVTKDGYASYSMEFTQDELEDFDEDSPLVVELSSSDLEDGLIAYYPFDGDADDHTSNGLDGTVHGATLTTDRNGVGNSAYNFDGNDYISVADNDLLDFGASDNFSLSLWVLVSPNQIPDGGINDIIRKWSGDTQGYPFGISFDNESAPAGYQKTFLAARYDGSACVHSSIGYTPVVTYNTFHHIVFTKQGTSLKLYLNNELAATFIDNVSEGGSCSPKNTSHMTFGTRGQLARFFTGKIDDIRIYDRTLSTNEISALFAE